MKTIQIWIQCYRPFIMGGSVHQPIATKVKVGEPVNLGKGFKGYLIDTPKGQRVVCAISGGIVGSSLEEVRADIKEGNAKFMKIQVAEMKKFGEGAFLAENEEFWNYLK